MKISPNIGLNIPEGSDTFDFDPFLKQNLEKLDDAILRPEYETFKQDLQTTDANAEMIAARGGEALLGDRLNKVDTALAEIATTPKKYGAKADGVTDDTQAIQNALNENDEVSIIGGTYLVNGTIKLSPGKSLKGDKTGTILIAHSSTKSTFELTYLNEIYGFNINQTNANWTGNMFEVSSKTLESSDAPVFVNLRNKIHDLDISPNSDYGTFLEIAAYKKDEQNVPYRVYGMWNNRVFNINLKGYLEYFCRSYCYKPAGTSETPWITVNEFRNINGDYCGYGWFGSKSNSTMSDEQYYNYNIRVLNSVIQCYTKSKNFAFLSGGYSQFYDCIPYDWSTTNTTNQNAFLLRNGTTYPTVQIKGTSGNFDLLTPATDAFEKQIIVNKCVANDKGELAEQTTTKFHVGDVGGTTYPTYKRIAKFKPTNSTYSTHFRLHAEHSKTLYSEFGLTYTTSDNTLVSEIRSSYVYPVNNIKFYYVKDGNGYVSIYLCLNISAIGWFIEYATPPIGSPSEYFIYLSIKDYGSNLDTTGMTAVTPLKAFVYPTDSSRISNDINSAGALAYDSTKGLLGFGRKTYGLTYIPIIETQDYTAAATSETVTISNMKWNGLNVKVLIQPLSAVTTVPYPTNINTSAGTFTINNVEVGKTYLIVYIYNEQ